MEIVMVSPEIFIKYICIAQLNIFENTVPNQLSNCFLLDFYFQFLNNFFILIHFPELSGQNI